MLQQVGAAGIDEAIGAAGGYGGAHGVELYHVDAASDAALAVHQLPTFFGSHSGAKSDFTNAFTVTEFMRIMHDLTPNY